MRRRGDEVTRFRALAAMAASGALLAAFASCADEGTPAASVPAEGGATLPETSVPEAEAPDAGCDGASDVCTTTIVSCADVAWCSVQTDVSVLYALAAVWGTAANDVWAVGSGGTIIHYDGTAWKDSPSGVHNTFFGIWGSGPNDVYAVSSSDVILHNSGTGTWKSVPSPNESFNNVFLTAIWGSSATDIRVGGRAYDLSIPELNVDTGDQFIKQSLADGGVAWKPLPGTTTIAGIWGSSPTDVWMVGDNSVYVNYQRGNTLHGKANPDAGADAGRGVDPLTFTSVDSQSNVTLSSVWGSSASDVWAVGALGTIRHITSADTRWQPVASPTTEDLRSVWGTSASDIWAVGDSGTILHWDGTAFTASTAQLPLGLRPRLNGVWGSGPNDVWIVGDGVVLHYTGPKAGSK